MLRELAWLDSEIHLGGANPQFTGSWHVCERVQKPPPLENLSGPSGIQAGAHIDSSWETPHRGDELLFQTDSFAADSAADAGHSRPAASAATAAHQFL